MPDKNIAVIGCGYWGKNLVRNFAELGALHTICDSSPALLESLAAKFPGLKTETDYRKIFANPEIKGVVISTPAVTHYALGREALLAGKDIFVEKPLSLTAAEGSELVDLAARLGRVLLVGHILEYHPAIVKLKELVDKGELGRINYVYSNRLNLGKIRTEENILWSFAPHDISVILLLTGGILPEHVSAHGAGYLNKDVADITVTTLAFPHDLRAHIFVSWLHPFKEQRLVVVGDKGMAEFNDLNPKDKLLLYRQPVEWIDQKPVAKPQKAEIVPIAAEEPLKLECQDFIDCIASRAKPRVDGRKGLKVLEILNACQASLELGGEVVEPGTGPTNVFIHESAIVEEPGLIGPGTRVWHFSHLMPGVKMGKNCVVGQNVFVAKAVNIGNNVKLENNVSLFEGVTLEDDVFCGPSCVFTNVINPRSHISRKNEYKPTVVKKGATIGANATIVCGHPVGKYAFIGAGSVVTHEVPDYGLVYGNPAKLEGWMCQCGVRLEFKGKEAHCAACGKNYLKGPDGLIGEK